MMQDMHRRNFILTAGATALATQTAAGANDRVNMAVVGIRSRGRDHADIYARQANSRVFAICDVDQAQTERAIPLLEKAQGVKPKVYQDFRKLLEDKDVDAVSLATCKPKIRASAKCAEARNTLTNWNSSFPISIIEAGFFLCIFVLIFKFFAYVIFTTAFCMVYCWATNCT